MLHAQGVSVGADPTDQHSVVRQAHVQVVRRVVVAGQLAALPAHVLDERVTLPTGQHVLHPNRMDGDVDPEVLWRAEVAEVFAP